ncbi:glycosyltransferase family 2 protein [Gammaproteobacteria bacterium]|nr:glycosyltransferase family 2 protein [Gammaproteobacteria bacterium]
MTGTLTLVVPVFNEEKALDVFLPELTEYCRQRDYALVFVDDGSSDDSAALIETYCDSTQFRLLRHKVNRGYGGAIKTGIRACTTDFLVTLDADGQHRPEDVGRLFEFASKNSADMVVGKRQSGNSGVYRAIGRKLIRWIAGLLVSLPISDLNSGMKLYRTELAKRYLVLCPDSMAFSDIITLVFVHRRDLVLETKIEVMPRSEGVSTINTSTALDTVFQILNIVALFNPGRIFFPLGVGFVLFGVAWGLPFIVRDEGVSVGTMLLLVFGLIFFLVGLIAEQVAQLRRGQIGEGR